MKTFTLVALFAFLLGCQANHESQTQVTENEPTVVPDGTGFDQQLADKLGADEYGMKPFVMAYLKRGPNRDQDSVTAAKLQRAHMDNIIRMAESGRAGSCRSVYG